MSARRPWLLPLTPVYAAGLGLKRQLGALGLAGAEATGESGD